MTDPVLECCLPALTASPSSASSFLAGGLMLEVIGGLFLGVSVRLASIPSWVEIAGIGCLVGGQLLLCVLVSTISRRRTRSFAV